MDAAAAEATREALKTNRHYAGVPTPEERALEAARARCIALERRREELRVHIDSSHVHELVEIDSKIDAANAATTKLQARLHIFARVLKRSRSKLKRLLASPM
jgi:hypothetical protein